MNKLTGHRLSHPVQTMGAYTARCACGLDVYGPTLPAMWTAHDVHLAVVRGLVRGA